jgi:hypothetical protein
MMRDRLKDQASSWLVQQHRISFLLFFNVPQAHFSEVSPLYHVEGIRRKRSNLAFSPFFSKQEVSLLCARSYP